MIRTKMMGELRKDEIDFVKRNWLYVYGKQTWEGQHGLDLRAEDDVWWERFLAACDGEEMAEARVTIRMALQELRQYRAGEWVEIEKT